jgi:hypothetical protein
MTQPVAEATMQLRYDGPALENNRMDVREVAPALLAMADAIRFASQSLYPNEPEPRIEIQATSPGSFIVELLVSDPGIWRRAAHLFSGEQFTAVANITGITGGVVTAIYTLVRIGRKRIRRAEPVIRKSGDPAIKITLNDGATFEVSEAAWRLMQDAPVRTAIRDVVQPLTREGHRKPGYLRWFPVSVRDQE